MSKPVSLSVFYAHTHGPAPTNTFDVFATGWRREGRKKGWGGVWIRWGQCSGGKKYVCSLCPSLSLLFFLYENTIEGILNENHSPARGQHKSHFILIPAYSLATESQDKWCVSYCQLGVQDSDSAPWDINKQGISLQADMQAERFPFPVRIRHSKMTFL